MRLKCPFIDNVKLLFFKSRLYIKFISERVLLGCTLRWFSFTKVNKHRQVPKLRVAHLLKGWFSNAKGSSVFNGTSSGHCSFGVGRMTEN